MKKLIKLDLARFITGFTDAEGCFLLSVARYKEYRLGWRVLLRFQISLHKKDKALLKQIQTYFGGDSISTKHGPQTIQYYVESVKDLAKVLEHFDKYPLITKKRADYELFVQAFNLIQNKEHLTEEGLRKIVAIKASLNLGLSEELKAAFPKILPVTRPSVLDYNIQDPHWFAGFTSGEGCFSINICQSSSYLSDFQVQLFFIISQHSRDLALMESLVSYLGCGRIKKVSTRPNEVNFVVTKFSDILGKIIPFFKTFTILGVKFKDFEDFCRVAELMQNKEHLTDEGLDQIREIKAGMNRGREFSDLK